MEPSSPEKREAPPRPRNILKAIQARVGTQNNDSLSPMGAWLNARIEAVEADSVTLSYEVRPEMSNPAGILHGGASAAMLDDVIGMTVYSLERQEFFATINLNMDYLSAARVGERVIAQSQIVRAGRTVIHATAELRTPAGKLVAKASSNLVASPYQRQIQQRPTAEPESGTHD